jgi:hypothetical protein
MRLPAIPLAGLALPQLHAQYTLPEEERLLGIIGRKLH